MIWIPETRIRERDDGIVAEWKEAGRWIRAEFDRATDDDVVTLNRIRFGGADIPARLDLVPSGVVRVLQSNGYCPAEVAR